jgi:hypothetical protein
VRLRALDAQGGRIQGCLVDRAFELRVPAGLAEEEQRCVAEVSGSRPGREARVDAVDDVPDTGVAVDHHDDVMP